MWRVVGIGLGLLRHDGEVESVVVQNDAVLDSAEQLIAVSITVSIWLALVSFVRSRICSWRLQTYWTSFEGFGIVGSKWGSNRRPCASEFSWAGVICFVSLEIGSCLWLVLGRTHIAPGGGGV